MLSTTSFFDIPSGLSLDDLEVHRIMDLSYEQREHMLHDFKSDINPILANVLKSYKDHSYAVYYIIHYNEIPLAYFSLCANAFFREQYKPSDALIALHERVQPYLKNRLLPKSKKLAAIKKIAQELGFNVQSQNDISSILLDLDKYSRILRDQQDPDYHTLHYSVYKPAIELLEFCRNQSDKAEQIIAALKFKGGRIGEFFFWKYIVPIVLETSQHIGCTYMMLYAADESDKHSLYTYYTSVLKFKVSIGATVQKSTYSAGSKLFVQTLTDLTKNQNEYLYKYEI